MRPFLVFGGNQFSKNYLIGNDRIDTIIKNRILKDYTNIKNILPFYYESAFYWFDSEKFGLKEEDLLEKNVGIRTVNYRFINGSIYLTVCKTNNNGFDDADYKAIKICFDPDDFGPDGYMLQDITIYQGPEIAEIVKQLKQNNYQNILNKYPNMPAKVDETDSSAELALNVIDIIPHLKKN